MPSTIVRVSGINGTTEVEINDEATVADVLSLADVSATSGLDIRSNGEAVDPSTPVAPGDQITATPSNVKLGA